MKYVKDGGVENFISASIIDDLIGIQDSFENRGNYGMRRVIRNNKSIHQSVMIIDYSLPKELRL